MIEYIKKYFTSKPRFIHKPKLVKEFIGIDGLVKYSIDSDLIFWTGKEQVIVKAVDEDGRVFLTNLASIPRVLHWLIKPDDKDLIYPSMLHDGLYDAKSIFNRIRADFLFLLALKAEKSSFTKRWFAFVFVRIFGSRYR